MIAAALSAAPLAARSPQPPPGPSACAAGAKAADLSLTLKDINGKSVALNAYRGQVVLLDFWATWCPPCRREIPGFIDLYTRYKSRGFVVLGVSMDDSPADVRKFMGTLGMNYPVLMGYGRTDLERAFGPLPGMPTSFIISRDGRICGQHTGFVEKDEFERQIKGLL